MTNPKTDPKNRKTTATQHPARPVPVTAPERQNTASATMIEACDRLGQKLDDFAVLFREQIEALRQVRAPGFPDPSARENALHRASDAPTMARVSSTEEMPPKGQTDEANAETRKGQREDNATHSVPTDQGGREAEQRRDAAATLPLPQPPGTATRSELQPPQEAGPRPVLPAHGGLAETAENARSLVDTLSQSAGGWPEQAAGVQQALESIMAYLENQAATPAPKVDVAGIIRRLRDLEEQQQSMQSQINVNR
jgi:hypothetical protein